MVITLSHMVITLLFNFPRTFMVITLSRMYSTRDDSLISGESSLIFSLSNTSPDCCVGYTTSALIRKVEQFGVAWIPPNLTSAATDYDSFRPLLYVLTSLDLSGSTLKFSLVEYIRERVKTINIRHK